VENSNLILYEISSNIAQILNIYLNRTEQKFPFYFFSILEYKRFPKNSINEILRKVKKIIRENHLEKFFEIDMKKSIERNIVNLINGYKTFVQKFSKNSKSVSILKKDLKEADLKNFYGISGEQNELIELIKYLYLNKNYFKVILLNGSIGSRDYKPGWSDIDIFIIIKKEFLSSTKNLRKLRRITINIRNFLMRYSILQLHGVVYSTEYHMQANFNEFFPIICLNNGQIITELSELQLTIQSNQVSALNYFKNEIYKDSKNLYFKSKIQTFDFLSKIRLLHRIFSFPFAFLQCLGVDVGKKESFNKICIEYQDIFPNISQFYEKINKFYTEWKIKKILTYKIRKYLSTVFSLDFLNKIFLKKEKFIVKQINNYFKIINQNNLLEEYNQYLDLANDYLENNFPNYQNPVHPYLKYDFYEYCIKKIRDVFSNFNEIISIYSFGSINAIGNSDIDLIFVIKDNIPFFIFLSRILRTKFTKNEQYLIFQHNPFVISESLAQFINYIRPCSNPVKIFGNEINFKSISNPYIKFALLVELLIFNKPHRSPASIDQIESIRIYLQVINASKFVINLFKEIKQEFNFESNISFHQAEIIWKNNDVIRKNMFFWDINKIKVHLNRSFIILNKLLLNIRIEIGQFIEKNALKKGFANLKEHKPVLRYGSYFFLADNKKLLKIQDIEFRRIDFIENYYNPWSFYFIFQNQYCLKNGFYEGIKERNQYLIKYLNYTSLYNQGENLYIPFWYQDKGHIFLRLFKFVPKSIQNKFTFYFYFWMIIRNIIENIVYFKEKKYLERFIKRIRNYFPFI